MRIALITDLHWGARNNSPIFIDYFKTFYDEVFFPYLHNHHIDTLIVLGDTFDIRNTTSHRVIQASRDIFFDRLAKEHIKTYLLIGNHDATFRNSLYLNTPELLLAHYQNIHIVKAPETRFFDGLQICLIPWICGDNYEASMKEIESTTADVLMGHLEVIGFEMHLGQIGEEGLPGSLFERFQLVMSGHYHHRSRKGNITYLGTPYELTWVDYNDPKGFHIFDTDSKDLTFIENPYRMFHKFYYDDSVENPLDKLQKFILHDPKQFHHTNIKVVVVAKDDQKTFDQFLTVLNSFDPNEVKIIEQSLDYLHSASNQIDLDASVNLEDTLSILMNYVNSVLVSNDHNDRIQSYLKQLYFEAINLNDKA